MRLKRDSVKSLCGFLKPNDYEPSCDQLLSLWSSQRRWFVWRWVGKDVSFPLKTTLLLHLPTSLCWCMRLCVKKIAEIDRNAAGGDATPWSVSVVTLAIMIHRSHWKQIYYENFIWTVCIYTHIVISQHALVQWLDHTTNAKGPFHLHGVPTLITAKFSEATPWGVAPTKIRALMYPESEEEEEESSGVFGFILGPPKDRCGSACAAYTLHLFKRQTQDGLCWIYIWLARNVNPTRISIY